MPRIDLPGGHHADLRDLDDLRRSDVRAILKSTDRSGSVDIVGQRVDGLDMTAGLQDELVVRMVTSWSLLDGDEPLPVTLAAVQDLPLRLYNPLARYVAPALAEVMGVGEETTPDPLSGAGSSS